MSEKLRITEGNIEDRLLQLSQVSKIKAFPHHTHFLPQGQTGCGNIRHSWPGNELLCACRGQGVGVRADLVSNKYVSSFHFPSPSTLDSKPGYQHSKSTFKV